MSLPSIVVFYKDGEVIKRSFINCGWICNIDTIKSAIKRTLEIEKDFEWDDAEAYGIKITKTDLNN